MYDDDPHGPTWNGHGLSSTISRHVHNEGLTSALILEFDVASQIVSDKCPPILAVGHVWTRTMPHALVVKNGLTLTYWYQTYVGILR